MPSSEGQITNSIKRHVQTKLDYVLNIPSNFSTLNNMSTSGKCGLVKESTNMDSCSHNYIRRGHLFNIVFVDFSS